MRLLALRVGMTYYWPWLPKSKPKASEQPLALPHAKVNAVALRNVSGENPAIP